MAGKKGKGKSEGTSKVTPFVPTRWPGKISDPDLFASFASQVRAKLAAEADSPLATFQIRQLGLKEFSGCKIILPKTSTIFRLQLEIAKVLFNNSVAPSEILIFKQNVESPFEAIERGVANRNSSYTSTLIEPDKNHIGIPSDFVCSDTSQTLLQCFSDLKTFKLPDSIKTTGVIPPDEDRMPEYSAAIMGRTKRYTAHLSEDKTLKKLSKLKEKKREANHHAYTIYFDVKAYCMIKLYKNNFHLLAKENPKWVFEKTDLDEPRESISNTDEPDYVHCPLLLYNILHAEKDVKKNKPVNLFEVAPKLMDEKKKITFHTLAMLKGKSKQARKAVEENVAKRPVIIRTETVEQPDSSRRSSLVRRLSIIRRSSVSQRPSSSQSGNLTSTDVELTRLSIIEAVEEKPTETA